MNGLKKIHTKTYLNGLFRKEIKYMEEWKPLDSEWETTDDGWTRRIISHRQSVYSEFCKSVIKLKKEHSFLNYLKAYYLLLMYEKITKK